MDKKLDIRDDELIDLGAVTEVTKGTDIVGFPDDDLGVKLSGGLGVE